MVSRPRGIDCVSLKGYRSCEPKGYRLCGASIVWASRGIDRVSLKGYRLCEPQGVSIVWASRSFIAKLYPKFVKGDSGIGDSQEVSRGKYTGIFRWRRCNLYHPRLIKLKFHFSQNSEKSQSEDQEQQSREWFHLQHSSSLFDDLRETDIFLITMYINHADPTTVKEAV